MPEYEYRAYFIGLDGHFISAKIIPCTDDESAIAATKQFVDGHAIELWHGNRKIAGFDPQAPNDIGKSSAATSDD